jgi:serine/threonine protein kinase/dipeptidyl aminopeptidase/acylaminoacyl peptidase
VAPATGTRIGPYEVTAKIGEGGMGEVYRATDSKLKRQVALKVLPPAFAADPERLARFEREAHVLASLNHPNIAAIYGFEDSTSVKALVMELVEGPTLADLIGSSGPQTPEADRVSTKPRDTAGSVIPPGAGSRRQSRLDDAACWAIARQIADALEAAHAHGVIHRDLKPANVKVRDDGTVKVLDFGLAKALAAEGAGTSSADTHNSPTMTSPALMSQMGMILGTAAYMAPEQARGRPVDKRADIWAFGVVLYEMLTGQAPFAGDTITDVLAAIVTRDPDLSRVPARFRRLVESCLQKDPRRRLRDIGDIELLLADGQAAQTPPALTRRPAWPAWIVAGAFALASGVIGWLYLQTPEPARPPVVQFEIGQGQRDVQSGLAVLSPDGQTLAYYAAEATGRYRLHLRRLDSLEERVIAATEISFAPQRPIWSPDGQHLAFWSANSTLMKMRLPDGSLELLTRSTTRPAGGAWNRDNVIVVGSLTHPLRRLTGTDEPTEHVSSLDRTAGDRGDTNPQFLPDGRHLLFVRQGGNASRAGLWITSLDNPEAERRLVEASAGEFAGNVPEIGPAVLFVRNERLFVQSFDLDRLELVGQARDLIGTGDGGLSVAPNGTVVFGNLVRQRPGVLTWFDRGGNTLGAVGDSTVYQSFAISPDGSRLAVAAGAGTGAGAELWSRDLVRGTELRLSAQREGIPLWSPDGNRLVFNSYRLGPASIFERPSNGTGTERLIYKDETDVFPNDLSDDGKFLVYTKFTGTPSHMDLFSLAMTGTDPKPSPYLAEPAQQKQAQFSPNGRFVAYTSNETGRYEIYVRPFPDASLGKWPISSAGGIEPRWSRDGKELFYWSGRKLMLTEVDTTTAFTAGKPHELFEAPIQPEYTNDGHRWQIGPDGKRFLVLTFPENQSSPIRVVLNWTGLIGD